MTRHQAEAPSKVRLVKWDKPAPPSEEEAEALLHQEGYEPFRWYDVPGATYPNHSHGHDECLWLLRGEMHFFIQDKEYILSSGDRLYLPANTPHKVKIPEKRSATYLVGRKK